LFQLEQPLNRTDSEVAINGVVAHPSVSTLNNPEAIKPEIIALRDPYCAWFDFSKIF